MISVDFASLRLGIYISFVLIITPVYLRSTIWIYQTLTTYHTGHSNDTGSLNNSLFMDFYRVGASNMLTCMIMFQILVVIHTLIVGVGAIHETGLIIFFISNILNISIRIAGTGWMSFFVPRTSEDIDKLQTDINSVRLTGIIFLNLIYFVVVLIAGVGIVTAEISTYVLRLSVVDAFSLVAIAIFSSYVTAAISEIILSILNVPDELIDEYAQ